MGQNIGHLEVSASANTLDARIEVLNIEDNFKIHVFNKNSKNGPVSLFFKKKHYEYLKGDDKECVFVCGNEDGDFHGHRGAGPASVASMLDSLDGHTNFETASCCSKAPSAQLKRKASTLKAGSKAASLKTSATTPRKTSCRTASAWARGHQTPSARTKSSWKRTGKAQSAVGSCEQIPPAARTKDQGCSWTC